ncbi:MAG: DHHW family protein [Oscillospiraceae bacterium]
MNKIRNYAIIAVFAVLLFGLGIWHLAAPDAALSYSERRKLAQAPELNAQAVFSGDYMEDLESYLLDQFPLRDSFRTVKAALRFGLFQQMDNNGVYLHEGSVCKMDYPLDEKQLAYAAEKLNSLYEQYLQGMNVYYAIVPDKNYFAAAPSGHMHMDYDALVSTMNAEMENMTYIDLFPLLTLEDYYRTDTHWKQECIYPVAEALAEAMGVGEALTPFADYTAHTLEPFYGVYYGQSALPVKPDSLSYMTSPDTESAVVTGAEFMGSRPVYDLEGFEGMDGYDVFLSGAQALLTIDCPNARTDRELVIFRDSFGSSIAPYLTGAYARITLVDLRYMTTELLGQFVAFTDQDVLFLYSTSLLNSARLLK